MTSAARPGVGVGCLRAYEDVVDLRSLLGLASEVLPARSRVRPWLEQIRLDLLEVAADLVGPLAGDAHPHLGGASVQWLRAVHVEAQLMLPADAPSRPWPYGISAASARLLLARAAARTAAHDIVPAIEDAALDPVVLEYLDLLALLLLTLARMFGSDAGTGRPRASRRLRSTPRLRLRGHARQAAPAPA